MTIEAAINATLAAHSGITAIVGTKIYPGNAGQDATLPWLVFRNVSDNPAHVLGGLPTLTEARFEFTAYAATYKQAAEISGQVKLCLRGFTGVMGGTGGVNVSACLDQGGPNAYEGDPKVFLSSTDFMISHDAV